MKKFMSFLFAGLMVFSMLTLAGCKRSEEEISKDAAPLVERICKKNGVEAKCSSITDIKEIGDNKYSAVAKIEDANGGSGSIDLDIEITYKDDNVKVEVKKLKSINLE